MGDAEAIAAAASRPTMRFVEVKTPEQQGLGMISRLRDPLVGQRRQTVNTLRGHLAEFGIITAKGPENIDKLRLAQGDEGSVDIPKALAAFAPPLERFRREPDVSAWLGLLPRRHSGADGPKLGRPRTSGQRDIRCLLGIDTMAVISNTKVRPPAGTSGFGRILALSTEETNPTIRRGNAEKDHRMTALDAGWHCLWPRSRKWAPDAPSRPRGQA